jgi:hypothetical protein
MLLEKNAVEQVCRIVLTILSVGLPDFSWKNIPKRVKIIPNYHKNIKWPQNIPDGCKIFQITIKYIEYHFKALQYIPNWVFCTKFTIWQP